MLIAASVYLEHLPIIDGEDMGYVLLGNSFVSSVRATSCPIYNIFRVLSLYFDIEPEYWLNLSIYNIFEHIYGLILILYTNNIY